MDDKPHAATISWQLAASVYEMGWDDRDILPFFVRCW